MLIWQGKHNLNCICLIWLINAWNTVPILEVAVLYTNFSGGFFPSFKSQGEYKTSCFMYRNNFVMLFTLTTQPEDLSAGNQCSLYTLSHSWWLNCNKLRQWRPSENCGIVIWVPRLHQGELDRQIEDEKSKVSSCSKMARLHQCKSEMCLPCI